jgi:hypothetical protein
MSILKLKTHFEFKVIIHFSCYLFPQDIERLTHLSRGASALFVSLKYLDKHRDKVILPHEILKLR